MNDINTRYLIAERSASGLRLVADRLVKPEAEEELKKPAKGKSQHTQLEALPYRLGELSETLSKMQIKRSTSK